MTTKKKFINYYSAQRIHWFRLNSCRKQKERIIQSPFFSHKISMLDAQMHSEPLLSELLGKNMISLHVKITCYLHVQKVHHCYGCTFRSEHWCWYKREEHCIATKKYEISLVVLKNIPLIHCACSWNIFQYLKRNFLSSCALQCNIFYVHSPKYWSTNPLAAPAPAVAALVPTWSPFSSGFMAGNFCCSIRTICVQHSFASCTYHWQR